MSYLRGAWYIVSAQLILAMVIFIFRHRVPGLGGRWQGNQGRSLRTPPGSDSHKPSFDPAALESTVPGNDIKRQGNVFLSSLSFPIWELRGLICPGGSYGMGEKTRGA